MKCVTVKTVDCDVRCDPKLITYENHVLPNGGIERRAVVAAGTLIDQGECPTADCVKLVKMGLADPADDDCRAAVNMTPEQIARAQLAQRKLTPMAPESDDDDEDEDWEEEFA